MASVEKRTREGRTTYLVRWRDPQGKQRSRSFDRKGPADRHRASVEVELIEGRYVDRAAGKVTVREYAEQWRGAQDHRPGTAALYERVLRLHVYPVLGARQLASVRHSDARAFVTGLSRTLAPNTARQVHAITRTIFRSAVADRLIPETPFHAIKLPAVRRDRVEPPASEDVGRIVEAAPERLRALVVLAAATGLRSGELLGLGVEHVDFLRREVKVTRQLVYVPGRPPYLGPPKTPESERSVPVPAFALEELARHLSAFPAGGDGLIFQADKGGPVLRSTLHGRWRMTLRRAGVGEQAHFHHLRHWWTTVLVAGGVPFTTVMELLGHAPQGVTWGVYTHKADGWERQVRNVLDTTWAQDVYPACNGAAVQAAEQGR